MHKIPVGILGATGVVGQHYLQLLSTHPWFTVNFLASSELSAGKSYREAVETKWRMKEPFLAELGNLPVHHIEEVETAKKKCSFVFSAISSEAATTFEEHYAAAGLPVISNTSAHRLTSDVPLLIPEANPEHIHMIPVQQRIRGWKRGFIVVKPNCSLQSFIIPLAPLHRRFKIKKLIITTMQAISGAGYPGVPSMDIMDNIIPFIPDEEEKTERESLKILGGFNKEEFCHAEGIAISAHCNRVPVLDGHMACVSVAFESTPSQEEILEIWNSFEGVPQKLNLPSAPMRPIIYSHEPDRPQPRLDRYNERGMAVTVGRLRKCPVLDFRFVGLSHNAIRGAAGGGILNAELLLTHNYLNAEAHRTPAQCAKAPLPLL